MPHEKNRKTGDCGFSAVEILITLAMIAILSGLAIPSLSTAMRDMQFAADTQSISSALNYTRLKAKSLMNPYRVAFDLRTNRWSIEKFNRGTGDWDVEQDVNDLSRGLSGSGIGFKSESGSSPGTFPGASSSNITFNSQGIPVNGTAPTGDNIVYISKSDSDLYAVTVALTGKVQVWKKSGERDWCAQ